MEMTDQVRNIVQILDDKKADDIVVMDVRSLTIIADYFIVASASNVNHVRTLSEEVQEKLAQQGTVPLRTEGENECRWVVIDYGDVLVHLFHAKEREFYQLERLWKVEGNYLDYSREQEEKMGPGAPKS